MEKARLDASTDSLCRTAAHVALCVVVLGATGCARLPRLYETITLGKPLDRSVLPPDVHVREDPGLGTITLTEYRQLLLPVGIFRYALRIQQNPEGEVSSVRLEEYHIAYWVLLIAGWDGERERYLDDSGQVQERTLAGPRFGIRTPVENLPVFLMGMRQCFGCEARALREKRKHAAQAVASPSQSPGP